MDPFGDVELTARLAPATSTTAGKAALRIGVVHTGLVGSLRVDGEHLAMGRGRPVDHRQVSLGCEDSGCPLRSFDRARFDGVLGGGEGVSSVGERFGEPVRYRATARSAWCRRWSCDHWRLLGGEVATLGDGGDVGPVDGEDGFEHVACFGDVV